MWLLLADKSLLYISPTPALPLYLSLSLSLSLSHMDLSYQELQYLSPPLVEQVTTREVLPTSSTPALIHCSCPLYCSVWGETPNFIEALTVGAGYVMDGDMKNGNWTRDLQFHQWSLLVPNSQVIVIPSPIDNAKRYSTYT